jgi:hypothetical protein
MFPSTFETHRPIVTRSEASANSSPRQRRTVAHFVAVLVVFSLLIAAFGIVAPSTVYAKPMSTSFQDAIAASETIAIVRLVELLTVGLDPVKYGSPP